MYVDGGIRGTASLDIAMRTRRDLIVCINPLVPYDNSAWGNKPFFHPTAATWTRRACRPCSRRSRASAPMPACTTRSSRSAGIIPNIDIIVIEPRPDDCQMFYYNIMHYAVLLLLAEHGFESVTLHLAEDYPNYKEILARHGIPFSRRIVVDELREIQESGYDPEVIRVVLEKRSIFLQSHATATASASSRRTLAELEMVLDGHSRDGKR